MDGILNIDKPPGKTSFSIVAMVRRLSGERRVGHAGTLDPAATGVLPVCLGQGTRVTEFLVDATKTYRGQIELGVATDTYDASGKITQQGDPSSISQSQVESALASFRGLIQQIPPMYSAVKHHGQPLYKLARAGIEIERRSRPTKIYHLEIINWQPPVVTIEVECGKGTYIRSLAHDLGQSLGCGANLKSLIRLRCGLFDIEAAISMPHLEDAFHYGYWQHFIYPIDSVLSHWRAMIVSDANEDVIRKGGSLVLENDDSSCGTGSPEQHYPPGSYAENYRRAYTLDGRFLGILRFDPEKGRWQPEKVFL
ncbi:tRNA pseudouridine(55) synthase TruB [Chloroflexota bacterium]